MFVQGWRLRGSSYPGGTLPAGRHTPRWHPNSQAHSSLCCGTSASVHLAKTSHVAKAEVKEQRIRVTRHGAKAGHVIRPGLSEAKRAPAWRSGAVSEDPGTVISSVWAPWCSQLASLRWWSWTQTRTPVSVAGDDDRLFL